MQFRLNAEQLNLLLEVLQEDPGGPAEGLFDRLIERDMRFSVDELEDLGHVLETHIHKLRDKIAGVTNGSGLTYEHRLHVLQQALDRVKECQAMV